jgi:hypothetical protein
MAAGDHTAGPIRKKMAFRNILSISRIEEGYLSFLQFQTRRHRRISKKHIYELFAMVPGRDEPFAIKKRSNQTDMDETVTLLLFG